MKVYIVYYYDYNLEDDSSLLEMHIQGVFDSKEKAENFIKKHSWAEMMEGELEWLFQKN